MQMHTNVHAHTHTYITYAHAVMHTHTHACTHTRTHTRTHTTAQFMGSICYYTAYLIVKNGAGCVPLTLILTLLYVLKYCRRMILRTPATKTSLTSAATTSARRASSCAGWPRSWCCWVRLWLTPGPTRCAARGTYRQNGSIAQLLTLSEHSVRLMSDCLFFAVNGIQELVSGNPSGKQLSLAEQGGENRNK